ncbi:hypothetical protein F0Q45_18640 [Mycobacterium simiae]|uniref:Uncharacterized protein n=1 Tax=Mycobacterium simiae TaxID=1784 RepID=A0A5B1BMW7_MYCSI|nr:hypothetical protein [Mycobacterium simiae]KAA1248800.1 hypothetical protein F0Q45_18640 [Mycobacterium simiae]
MTPINPYQLPDDVVGLFPQDGLDGLAFFFFDYEGKIGIGLTVRTKNLGEFIIPLTATQIGAIRLACDHIANLTEEDCDRILADLRLQGEGR